MKIELACKKFKKEDYPEYFSWFQDPDLNKRLGPMEEEDEWLDYALNEEDGGTYSLFLNEKLVAVIGIAYPDKEDAIYVITSIAVKPSLRSKGIGQQVLKKIIKLHPLTQGQSWIAYVDEKNPNAKLFFENNGWRCKSTPPENNNMFAFEYKE